MTGSLRVVSGGAGAVTDRAGQRRRIGQAFQVGAGGRRVRRTELGSLRMVTSRVRIGTMNGANSSRHCNVTPWRGLLIQLSG